MTLRKVSKAPIPHNPQLIRLVFCVRNEQFRLPFFLDYYRKLGVDEFIAIDNGSTDDTQPYLLKQADVHLFFTDQEYKSSNAGRDWLYEVAHKYCLDSWCLTIDVDEFLVYPNVEAIDLKGLTAYLDASGYQGLFSLFLDFYSDLPLSQTQYQPGQSPFDICEYYDPAESYTCYEREIFPYVEIKGGPRQRVFWPGQDKQVGPSMRKLVLIKWNDRFQYTHSTHSCVPIRLADVTGAIAHFKFLSHFADYAKSEVKRNARIANSIDWKVYSAALEGNDVCFYSPDQSRKYLNSSSLVQDSLIRSSTKFKHFCENQVRAGDAQEIFRKTSPEKSSTQTQFAEVVAIWPALSSLTEQIDNAGIEVSLLKRFETDVNNAANSRLWRSTYPLRKLASKFGLTDQRSLTEENFYNQNLHARFVFTFKSIWWDLLGPFRVIEKVFRRLRRRSN